MFPSFKSAFGAKLIKQTNLIESIDRVGWFLREDIMKARMVTIKLVLLVLSFLCATASWVAYRIRDGCKKQFKNQPVEGCSLKAWHLSFQSRPPPIFGK